MRFAAPKPIDVKITSYMINDEPRLNVLSWISSKVELFHDIDFTKYFIRKVNLLRSPKKIYFKQHTSIILSSFINFEAPLLPRTAFKR